MQSFYVTVDLSSAPSTTQARKKRKTAGGRSTSTPAAAIPADVATQTPEVPPNTDRRGSTTLETPDPEERIQILEIHSKNPIISYQNQLYSCQWTSTIGTDILLSSPDLDSNFPRLRREQGFDILAATSIKLVGQPAQLIPRYDVRMTRSAGTEPRASNVEATTEREHVDVPKGPAQLQVGPESGRLRLNQARFLDRLIAAKAARGEKDAVTVHSKKRLTGNGWRTWHNRGATSEQQQEGEEAEDSDWGDDDAGQGPVSSTVGGARAGRARGGGSTGRRRTTRVRARGGLFRDYRPTAGDGQGADIRGVPDNTPQSWGQLDRNVAGREASSQDVVDSNIQVPQADVVMEDGQ